MSYHGEFGDRLDAPESSEPRSIEETESPKKDWRDLLLEDLRRVRANEREASGQRTDEMYAIADAWAAALRSLEAERDEAVARYESINWSSRNWTNARREDKARIGSLVGEREELREVARKMCETYPSYEEMDPLRALLGLPLYVDTLSSRETTDESNTSDERVAISAENEPPGLCPTCGGDRDHPNKTTDVWVENWGWAWCRDTFHSTDRGKAVSAGEGSDAGARSPAPGP